MTSLELIESKRGKPVILYAGFKFNFKLQNKNSTLRCICARRNCPGIILTDESKTTILKEKAHTCVPDIAKAEIEKSIFTAKKRTREESTSLPNIYKEELMNVKDAGLEFVTNVPDFSSLKSALYRTRNKALGVVKFPKSRGEIFISDEFKDMLVIDDGVGVDQERMLVFASKNFYLLAGVQFFVDGTFRSCCPLFEQLYTIHVDVGSTDQTTSVIPAVYALLPIRKEGTYNRLFSLIKERAKFKPEKIHIDFEKGAINALKGQFPEAKIIGCNFHYNQALWRKVQEIGLVLMYREMTEIRQHIRMCAALAHLPQIFHSDAWIEIMSAAPQNELLEKFNDYFVNQWMEADPIWICHGERHRTTNTVEGWHCRLNKKVGKPNPNIFELMKALKEVINYYDIMYQKVINYMQTSKRAKKYIDLDCGIKQIVNSLLENKDTTVFKTLQKLSFAVKLD